MSSTHLLACLRAGIACLALLATNAMASPAAGEKPMNIVFLLADDWRFDTLGVAGNPIVKTPHLDRLAAKGVRFTHACVTTSICGVSRSSLLSGQWMSRHGNRDFKSMKTPWSESYPGRLRQNGYHVGHVGKWHSGPFPAQEFDFGRAYSGRHWIKKPDGSEVHVTRKNEEDALEFLNTRPKEKPFMLNLWFFAPHAQDEHPDQFRPQPESMALYEDMEIPVPPLFNKTALESLPPFIQKPSNEGRVRFNWRFDTPAKYQKMMKNYYRLCTEVDAVCGRVIQELEAQGVLDHTMVIFMADNGYYHGDRMLADKWYPHQESIRVPLIVHDPRMPASARGTTNDHFVLNVDIAPSVLAACHIDPPRRMQGRDFGPLYLNPGETITPEWREEFFYEHGTITSKDRIPSSEAIVRKDIKYVRWPEWDFEELFDLAADPLELKNVAEESEYADRRASLKSHLNTIREQAR